MVTYANTVGGTCLGQKGSVFEARLGVNSSTIERIALPAGLRGISIQALRPHTVAEQIYKLFKTFSRL